MDAVCLAFGMPSMSDLATRAFWLSLVLAAVIGFGAEIGLLRWCAIGWLGLIGCLFSLLNWAYLVIQVRNGGNGPSFIPFVGDVLVMTALAAIPFRAWRLWMPIGLLLDPTPAIFFIGGVGAWIRARRNHKSERP
jgi:hypothetical protein